VSTPSGGTPRRTPYVRRLLRRAFGSLVPRGDAFYEALRCLGAGAPILPPPADMSRSRTPAPARPERDRSDRRSTRPVGQEAGWLPGGPPPNHPERLVAHVSPSPEEARLWAELSKEVP
jgi:hypothetical protein